jgi:hypothetical protein
MRGTLFFPISSKLIKSQIKKGMHTLFPVCSLVIIVFWQRVCAVPREEHLPLSFTLPTRTSPQTKWTCKSSWLKFVNNSSAILSPFWKASSQTAWSSISRIWWSNTKREKRKMSFTSKSLETLFTSEHWTQKWKDMGKGSCYIRTGEDMRANGKATWEKGEAMKCILIKISTSDSSPMEKLMDMEFTPGKMVSNMMGNG